MGSKNYCPNHIIYIGIDPQPQEFKSSSPAWRSPAPWTFTKFVSEDPCDANTVCFAVLGAPGLQASGGSKLSLGNVGWRSPVDDK